MNILDSLSFASMSNPNVNNALFASGSGDGPTLYWRRANGNVFDLAAANGRIQLKQYAGPLTDQAYIRPSNLKFLKIIAIGGGGGGGSGRASGTGTRFGGCGGGGGAIVYVQLARADLTNVCYINVGSGGAGAASVAAINNGNGGSDGGATSFRRATGVVLARAEGGEGGRGGSQSNLSGTTTCGGYGGSLSSSIPPYSPFSVCGYTGGGHSAPGRATAAGNIFPNAPRHALSAFSATGLNNSSLGVHMANIPIQQGCGGGGAGGTFAANPDFIQPGTGSGVWAVTGLTMGGLAGQNGQSNIGTNFITQFPIEINPTIGLGCGGGGGTALSVGEDGGDGGLYGAGGGGGGAGTTVSGHGGDGAPGMLILLEYY